MSKVKPKLIVAVGASAGGLKPIEELFRNMPPDTGMAFVVVQHLSPDFKSLMDELLGRHTGMPIHRATDGIELAPNEIYLIPPKKDLTVSDGRLILHEQQKTRGLNLPIDSFFASLAQNVGKDAVTIVLSGSDSDGSCGAQEIHDAGGLVVVQTPDTARFDSMPLAAIKTKVVDLVCEVHEMPDHLVNYCRHRDVGSFSITDGTPVDLGRLSWLFQLFQEQAGIDFSQYKPGTLQRRLKRRMQLLAISNLDEYRQRVETD